MIVKKNMLFSGYFKKMNPGMEFFSLNQGRHSVVFQLGGTLYKAYPGQQVRTANMIPKAPNYSLRVEHFSTYFRNLNAGDFCG